MGVVLVTGMKEPILDMPDDLNGIEVNNCPCPVRSQSSATT
jgi:hypothetical protein